MAKEYRLSIIVTGKDSGATAMLGGIGGSLRSIGTIAGGILTSQVFTFIARQVGQLVTSAFQATAQMQNMEMTLTSLQARELIKTGDFEDMNAALEAAIPLAKQTMKELERIAVLSPYQLQNVTNTYKMAQAFGYSAKEATLFTGALLNMSAGIGANGEMLDRMAYNLAQVRLQGKVTALDIRQLAMAGFDLVDVLKYVGKQMGVNIEDHLDFNKAIEEGTITWEDFTTHFAEYADKNFGGAADRMSRTLFGLQSTLKDVFMLSMPKLLGPLAERVTGSLNEVLDAFLAFVDSGALEKAGQQLVDFFDGPAFKNGFVGLTGAFRDWVDGIDWEAVSQNLAAGIDSIDWALLGQHTRTGLGNIAESIEIFFAEVDWSSLAESGGRALLNFLAGLTGEQDWQNVKDVWSENADQLAQIIEDKKLGELAVPIWEVTAIGRAFEELKVLFATGMDSVKTSTGGKVNEMSLSLGVLSAAAGTNVWTNFAVQLGTGLGFINIKLQEWAIAIFEKLTQMKNTFREQFQQMITAARSRIENLGPSLVDAVKNLLDMIKSAIVPLAINISLPDFEKLAETAAAGMAMLNAALGGGGQQSDKPRTPRDAGGNPIKNGQMQAFAGGGISSGPRSGYLAMLHGTEAVIPLDGGNVPVKLSGALNPSGGHGAMVINVSVNWAPVISTSARREAQEVVAPMIADGVRAEFQKRGL